MSTLVIGYNLENTYSLGTPRLSSAGKVYVSVAIALVFAIFLAALPVDQFVDRDAYLAYAEGSLAIFVLNAANGVATVLVNEPLWLLINGLLSVFFDAESCVRIIVGVSAYLVARSVTKNNFQQIFAVLLFMLLPQFLKNYVIHLRQGLAIAVFMIGWYRFDGRRGWGVMLLTPFIHASFFFLIFFLFLNRLLEAIRASATIRVIAFFAVGVFLSFATIWLAAGLGARQAGEYQGSAAADSSGLGFLFWLMFGCIYALQGRKFLRENMLAVGVLIFYLAGYFFLPVAARIFESALLLILIAGLDLTNYRKTAFWILFSFYFFAQWYPRLSLPGLGWGVENYV